MDRRENLAKGGQMTLTAMVVFHRALFKPMQFHPQLLFLEELTKDIGIVKIT